MALSFKKNIVVGVSVSPERGLEVAQIDFATRTILKYGSKQLTYDNIRKEIADMDIFKETLLDLFLELEIPKGSEVVLNLPSVVFKVADYPASLNEEQIKGVIEEELLNIPIFQDNDPAISNIKLPNSTIQFNKIAYTAAQKVMLIEIILQIKELGYKLIGIDTSVNSTLNALIYNDRVDVSVDNNWLMLIVENSCCRIIPVQGNNYIDCFEEKISIGEVLGDAENYATVLNAVSPILKNLPAQRLYVVSKTDVISAQILADKLTYNAQIIHEEANIFNKTPFLDIAADIDEKIACTISLDVIGAAINREFMQYSTAKFNLFNASLGDIYILEQPPVIKLGEKLFVLSIENMIIASFVMFVIVALATVLALLPINNNLNNKKQDLANLKRDISQIDKFLAENESISSELFDEGDEIKIGLVHNKNIYSYFTIVGTEIPQKLWLTGLNFGNHITIEGQADNLESVYSFFRSIKDYNPSSNIKLQKLALATNSKMSTLSDDATFDTDSIITSMNADYYEFRISDAPEFVKDNKNKNEKNKLPDLEPIN